MNLAVGDVVVYGTHGMGRITGRRKQVVAGAKQEVVVLELQEGLTVTLPVERALEQLRPPASAADLREVQVALRAPRELSQDTWLVRRREMQAKLADGRPVLLAEIVGEGAQRERRPTSGKVTKLSGSEKELFTRARQLLSDEVAMARGSTRTLRTTGSSSSSTRPEAVGRPAAAPSAAGLRSPASRADTSTARSTNIPAVQVRSRSRCHAIAILRGGSRDSIGSVTSGEAPASAASRGARPQPRPAVTNACSVEVSSTRCVNRGVRPCRVNVSSSCPRPERGSSAISGTAATSSSVSSRPSRAYGWSSATRRTYGSSSSSAASSDPSGSGHSVKATSSSPFSSSSRSSWSSFECRQRELDLTRLGPELLEDQRQDRGGDALVGADADGPADVLARRASRGRSRAADRRRHDRLRVAEQQLAGARQRDGPRASGSVEQPMAHVALERRDLLGDGRLGVAELERGRAERALVGNRPQRRQVSDLDAMWDDGCSIARVGRAPSR